MLGHQFAYSAAPLRKVKEVQFGILSPEEIVRVLLDCERCDGSLLDSESTVGRQN